MTGEQDVLLLGSVDRIAVAMLLNRYGLDLVLLSPEFAENIRRMKAEIDLEVKASQARFPSLLGVRLKQEELILQY